MLGVLVSPPRHREQDSGPGWHFSVAGGAHQPSERVSRLQSRDYPFGASQQLECVQDFGVRGRPVARPADLAKVSVLWPDSGVVEARRDRFGLEDLADRYPAQVILWPLDVTDYLAAEAAFITFQASIDLGRFTT